MGVLRVLMALSVMLAHMPVLGTYQMVGGQIAVEVFFMISGFYMALILNEKYVGAGALKAFYENRFVKIYSMYWLVLAFILSATLLVVFLSQSEVWLRLSIWKNGWNLLQFESIFYLIFVNIFIMGQDLVMWLGFTPQGGLDFVVDFSKTSPQLHQFLLIPQAWSLSLELLFYLMAPFVVRSPRRLLILFFFSLCVRIILVLNGLDYDPWSYRFFPAELMFFAAGSLGYWHYKFIKNKGEKDLPYWRYGCLLLAFVATVMYGYFPKYDFVGVDVKMYVYDAFVAFCLPYLFFMCRKIKFDRLLGELSYPLYLSHLFVILLVYGIGLREGELLWGSLLGTLIVSTILAVFCHFTVEKVRTRIAAKVQPVQMADK